MYGLRHARHTGATSLPHTMEDEPKTLLLTLTGKDRPGVTSAMFDVLATAGVEVLDIEQIVLRRRLLLGILVTAPRDWKKPVSYTHLTLPTILRV